MRIAADTEAKVCVVVTVMMNEMEVVMMVLMMVEVVMVMMMRMMMVMLVLMLNAADLMKIVVSEHVHDVMVHGLCVDVDVIVCVHVV